MTFDGEYGASTWDWVAEQVEDYEGSNGAKGATLRDTGMPIIILTTVGHKSGLVRKVPLMRVERDGEYAIIASKGGAPEQPGWYHNLVANPNILLQDGPEPYETVVRLVTGAEREDWWELSESIFPPYKDYKQKTDREIPVFISESRD